VLAGFRRFPQITNSPSLNRLRHNSQSASLRCAAGSRPGAAKVPRTGAQARVIAA